MSQVFAKSIITAAVSIAAALSAGCASTPAPAAAAADDNGADAEGSEDTVAAAASPTFKVPRFEKIPVGQAGFDAYVPKGFPAFSSAKSDDGALVESAELEHDGITFALIGVKLNEPLSNDDEKEEVLIAYLEHLKTAFDVKDAVGYGRGHRLESAPDAHGVIDYWQTTDGEQIAVKGWMTRSHIAVYTIWTKGDLPPLGVMTMFFDGVRFPVKARQ